MPTPLARIRPVNPVEEPWKVALLARAYRAHEEVTPVVVLRLGRALLALSGSHRLAAMDRAFGGRMSVEEAVGLDLVLLFDAPAIPAVEALRVGRMDHAAMVAIVEAIPACADAMEDQL